MFLTIIMMVNLVGTEKIAWNAWLSSFGLPSCGWSELNA